MTLSSTSKASCDGQISISAQGISLHYRMPNRNVGTLKEAVVAFFKKRQHTQKFKMAIKNASIIAHKGECIALLGHNGCGKSTFLKVIAGILRPQLGQVKVEGTIAPLIELGAGFDAELSGIENIYLSCSLMGLTTEEIDGKLEGIKKFSELGEALEDPVKTYSSGMYMRLAFSCAVAIDAEIMLIDEILAVGDQNFQKKCLAKIHEIRDSGTTIVLVSHDLKTICSLAERVYVMDEGEVLFEGEAGKGVAFYNAQMRKKELLTLPHELRVEEQRRDELLASSAYHVRGSEVSIESVRISSPHGVNKLASGEDGILQVEIDVKKDFEDHVKVGFAILKEGVRMGGGNTGASQLVIKERGRYKVNFILNGFPLASGEYSLMVGVHDSQIRKWYDQRLAAGIFNVRDSSSPENLDCDLISPKVLIKDISLEISQDGDLQ
jgi:ABC-2 type transport system ATP-binding protein